MTLREIIAELQSIGYQLDSALNGNSTLQGASSDLNLLLDMLEKQEISEASVTRQKLIRQQMKIREILGSIVLVVMGYIILVMAFSM